MTRPSSLRSSLAGAGALGAGLAWVAWAVLNARTNGGLDVGPPAVDASLARAGTWFGTFTLVLAAFALWDAVLTSWAGVPFALYLTAAPKLPLSIVWDFWLAWLLFAPRVRTEPVLAPQSV